MTTDLLAPFYDTKLVVARPILAQSKHGRSRLEACLKPPPHVWTQSRVLGSGHCSGPIVQRQRAHRKRPDDARVDERGWAVDARAHARHLFERRPFGRLEPCSTLRFFSRQDLWGPCLHNFEPARDLVSSLRSSRPRALFRNRMVLSLALPAPLA